MILAKACAGSSAGNDAFELRAELEGVKRFLVGRREIGHPADVVEPGVLGPDARIVEPGGDRVAFENLTVIGLQKIGAVAVQHARASAIDRGCVAVGNVEPMASRFDPEDLDLRLVEERVK